MSAAYQSLWEEGASLIQDHECREGEVRDAWNRMKGTMRLVELAIPGGKIDQAL
jgi:hypothetical protein